MENGGGGRRRGFTEQEAGLAAGGGGPKTLRGSAARLGRETAGPRRAACLVSLRPWRGGTLDSATRGSSARWAGEGGKRRDFRFLLGWGLAAERSWHFQIGAWAAPPPGPSPRHRAGRLGRSRPALLARWVLPGRASASLPFPVLPSPLLLSSRLFSPPSPWAPRCEGGQEGRRAAPAGRQWPARGTCPGSRVWRRKAWVASGRRRASSNPVTPKVERVKELFKKNDQRGPPAPRHLVPVPGMELGGVCLVRACEQKE